MSHGHDDHGHAAAGVPLHGPAEFPPVPNPRSISPAREDFDAPWPGKLLVWPFLWTVVALLFFVAARSWGHPIGEHDAAESDAEPGAESPHGADPAMGNEHAR